MTRRLSLKILVILLAVSGSLSAEELHLLQSIELPDVENRIDHMDLDPATMRLFVGALENDSLEVVDLRRGLVVRRQRGLGGPQGVAFLPKTNEVVVAGRDTGTLLFLDAADGHEKRRIEFGSEADNLHYVPSLDLLVLGYGNGGVAQIQASTGKVVGRTQVGGHPEGVQVQASTGLALANVPTRGKIVAIDLVKATVKAEWKPEGILSNFPLAVEDGVPRGAYYTHVPSQVVLLNTLTGQSLSQTPAPGDVDDLFFDEGSQRLYLISGSGRVEVWSVATPQPRVLGSVPTGSGARTGLLVPALKRLFVAVPQRKGMPARILVFEVD